MTRHNKSELAAGMFVIACAAALVGIIIWLGGLHLGGRYAYLTARAADGDTSIRLDSAVRIGTVDVGKIDRVTTSDDWNTFAYRIRLCRDVKIHQDALVQAVAPTLGGVGALTILSTGSEKLPLADNLHPARLDMGPNPLIANMMTQLGYGPEQREAFQQALADIQMAMGGVRGMTDVLHDQMSAGNPENLLGQAYGAIMALRQAAQSVESATGETAAMMRTIRPGVESVVADAAESVHQVSLYTKGDLGELLTNLRQASTSVLSAANNLRDTTGAAKDMVCLQRSNIERTIANLAQVSDNLKATSREVRRRPWLLLAKSDTQDVRSHNIESAALAFADGANQLDGALENLKSLEATEEKPIAVDDPQLALIRQKLDDSFEKFNQAEQALWKELAK